MSERGPQRWESERRILDPDSRPVHGEWPAISIEVGQTETIVLSGLQSGDLVLVQ